MPLFYLVFRKWTFLYSSFSSRGTKTLKEYHEISDKKHSFLTLRYIIRLVSLQFYDYSTEQKSITNSLITIKNGKIFLALCCKQTYIPVIRRTPYLENINNPKDKFCNDDFIIRWEWKPVSNRKK